jgi:ribosome-binding ATPase
MRHRRPAQRRQVDPLQRADQGRHRRGQLPVLHDRPQRRRGAGARSAARCQLAEIVKPQKVIPTAVEFVDIAGLVAGAASGEGLGNKFLAHIREVDAIAHVVRCFEHGDIIHVAGKVDPISDIETIDTELALADLDSVEKALNRAERRPRRRQGRHRPRRGAGEVRARPRPGRRARGLDVRGAALLRDLFLLTLKPVMYVANVREDGFATIRTSTRCASAPPAEGAEVVPVCAAIEEELASSTTPTATPSWPTWASTSRA